MSETKVFRVSGRIDKPGLYEPFTFNKEIAAAKEAHALEKIYAEMGSRHRAKRFQVKIDSIEEVVPKEGA
ncbi:MAG: 50S ribosomal protein L18Ae [Candidatus Bathyarchaeota archaeon]|nr:50S ribosomal protein L18Ae [Candidatus Bathyarchaeota archaeon]